MTDYPTLNPLAVQLLRVHALQKLLRSLNQTHRRHLAATAIELALCESILDQCFCVPQDRLEQALLEVIGAFEKEALAAIETAAGGAS